MRREAVAAAIDGYHHWYHRIELAPGLVTPGINDCDRVLGMLDLPADLRGKRVLDIGARDGYFSFVCEQRGASVVAVDYMPAVATGFAIAASVLGSRVRYVQENIYQLDAQRFGKFDIVLMLGLLYHLRDPLGAIDIARDLCEDRLLLETYVCDDQFVDLAQVPIMRFCPGSSLNADPTNYWAPNSACVKAMLREAAFEVRDGPRWGNRAVFDAKAVADREALYQRAIARGERHP
jgi:tRNA (mo5U34)-methyltransferase